MICVPIVVERHNFLVSYRLPVLPHLTSASEPLGKPLGCLNRRYTVLAVAYWDVANFHQQTPSSAFLPPPRPVSPRRLPPRHPPPAPIIGAIRPLMN